LLARGPRLQTSDWLRACDAYVTATLVHTRYLRTKGRMADPESAREIAALETVVASLADVDVGWLPERAVA
jgi:hypothetical protein